MSKRKPHNLKARIERSCRALLSTNHVAVVNIDPSGRQGMINYKSLKNIAPGKIGQAVCGIPTGGRSTSALYVSMPAATATASRLRWLRKASTSPTTWRT